MYYVIECFPVCFLLSNSKLYVGKDHFYFLFGALVSGLSTEIQHVQYIFIHLINEWMDSWMNE